MTRKHGGGGLIAQITWSRCPLKVLAGLGPAVLTRPNEKGCLWSSLPLLPASCSMTRHMPALCRYSLKPSVAGPPRLWIALGPEFNKAVYDDFDTIWVAEAGSKSIHPLAKQCLRLRTHSTVALLCCLHAAFQVEFVFDVIHPP